MSGSSSTLDVTLNNFTWPPNLNSNQGLKPNPHRGTCDSDCVCVSFSILSVVCPFLVPSMFLFCSFFIRSTVTFWPGGLGDLLWANSPMYNECWPNSFQIQGKFLLTQKILNTHYDNEKHWCLFIFSFLSVVPRFTWRQHWPQSVWMFLQSRKIQVTFSQIKHSGVTLHCVFPNKNKVLQH